MDRTEEMAEAQRAANILTSALVGCYEWVIANPDSGFDERAVLSSIRLEKLGGVAGTMLAQQAKLAGVMVRAEPPLAAYIPQRCTFLVSINFLQEWKTLVTDALRQQAEALNAQRADELRALEESRQADRQREEDMRGVEQVVHTLRTELEHTRSVLATVQAERDALLSAASATGISTEPIDGEKDA